MGYAFVTGRRYSAAPALWWDFGMRRTLLGFLFVLASCTLGAAQRLVTTRSPCLGLWLIGHDA